MPAFYSTDHQRKAGLNKVVYSIAFPIQVYKKLPRKTIWQSFFLSLESQPMMRGIGKHIRRLAAQNLELNLLAILIGTIGGFGALLFRYLLFFINDLSFFHKSSIHFITPLINHAGWTVLIIPAAGGLIVGLITYYFAPETKGHGVPEVMEAMARHGGRIRPRVALAKVVASGVCIGTGGSAGREGPIVQIGSAAGSTIGQWLKLSSSDIRVLVGCGAAAGIAATFNAPLAGVLFSIELILLELKTRSFVPLVIASTFATIISRIFLGAEPMIRVPPYQFRSPYELVLYLFLGLFAALVGYIEIVSLYGTESVFDRMKIHPILKPALGGLLLGAIALWLPNILGTGYSTVGEVVNLQLGNGGLSLLGFFVLLMVAKIVALSLTLGSGGSGGVFAPSLFIGAAFGGAFGVIVNMLFPAMSAPYPAYALVGMAAVFSATSRASLTSIVMLFEMTRNYNIILPLMFACVVADVAAWLLYPDTIYTKKLSLRGVRVDQDLGFNVLRTRFVSDAMTRKVQSVPQSLPVEKVQEEILQTGHQGFPVVDKDGRLLGIITGKDVIQAMKDDPKLPAITVAHHQLAVTYPDETLDDAWERMGELGIGHLPVVSRNDPSKIVGFITKGDIAHFARPT